MKKITAPIVALGTAAALCVSAPAAVAVTCPTGQWSADYFANTTLSGAPALARCDPALDFTWWGGSPGPGVPADGFSVRWSRTVSFAAGTYSFTLRGDDGIRLKVDGVTVLDGWRDQEPTTYTTTRTLPAGNHVLVVEYYDNAYDASATFGYGPAAAPPADANLISNADLAKGSPVPTCFSDGGWGQSTIVSGTSTDVPSGASGRSWKITVSGYVSGDQKLVPSDAAGCVGTVDATKGYTVGFAYKATAAQLSIPVFVQGAGGWEYWTTLRALPAAATWTKVEAALPALPAGTTKVSFGVAVAGNGNLFTTAFSLRPTAAAPEQPQPPTGLALTGRWTVAPSPSPVRAMHSTLLRDGRVLMVAGSGNNADAFAAGSFSTSVWDPVKNTFLSVPTPVDMFCSGHVTLPDGKVLVQGGTGAYAGQTTNYQGLKKSYVFDPATNRYTATNDTQEGHWYPTLTKLENGDVWMAGGYSETGGGAYRTEMFDVGQNRWLGLDEVPQTWEDWGTYPHMFLLGDGRLFYDGGHTFGNARPGSGATVYDWRTKARGDVPGLRDAQLRDQAGSVLLPPAQNQTFLIAGGGSVTNNLPPTDKVDVVNMNAASPRYVPAPDLPGGARLYLNLTNLPDRTVLASNGGTTTQGGDVLAASIYNPLTNAWTAVAADPVGRNYHSSALLLPDGRVAVMGSNPLDGSWVPEISVYEPPYLFKGTRPTITAAPTDVTYGASFALQATGSVVSASLTSAGSVTHQTDTNSRLVDLPLAGNSTSTTRTATVPSNRALLPPGPYMLTVLDDKGSVSVARWITVR